MVSEASDWGWGRPEQGRTVVKSGRPRDAPLCVSEERTDSLRAPLEWQEAQGMRGACFTNVPNRGMADLVWEVLGGTVGARAEACSFCLCQERLLAWACVPRVFPNFHRGWGWKYQPICEGRGTSGRRGALPGLAQSWLTVSAGWDPRGGRG